jgi:hypothetical protein
LAAKSLLVICAFPFMVAGGVWGLMYYFVREPRGTVHVKDKGEMDVWLVLSAK